MFIHRIIKRMAEGLLRLDGRIVRRGKEGEYASNAACDITEGLITDQRSDRVSRLRFGKYPLSRNGCGPIAVYNAMLFLGVRGVSLARIVRTFEREGVLSGGSLLSGALGVNPYAMHRAVSAMGLVCTSVSRFEELGQREGVYILAVWNGVRVTAGMHYFTVRAGVDGEFAAVNGRIPGADVMEDRFVMGYRLSLAAE